MTPVLKPDLGTPDAPRVYGAFFDRRVTLPELVGSLDGVIAYVSLKQVHGARVVTLGEAEGQQIISRGTASLNEFSADACVTKKAGLLLSVHTADCVPLLAAAGEIIGACHGGWRGVSLGITENFVGALGALGAKKSEIKIALGPAIGPCHFEVKKDVSAQLVTKDIPAHVAATLTRRHPDPEKDYVDLRELVRYKLLRLGLSAQNIYKSEDCTYCDAARFFSFRRESAQKGRLEAVIVNSVQTK